MNHWLDWIVLAIAAAIAGFWYLQASDDLVQVFAVLAVAVAAAVGALWQSRVRAVRRLRTALDTYVERALARERRSKLEMRRAARMLDVIDSRPSEPLSMVSREE